MEKQRWEESKRRREEERTSERKKSEKKRPSGRKGRKVAIHFVFPMICGAGGSERRLAKAAGAEPCGQMREENLHTIVARNKFRDSKWTKHHMFGPLLEVAMSKKCTPLWREPHFQVKSVKKNTG